MIKINNLNKYYNKSKNNEIHVIDDTSLELPSTGLICFIGKSGSGKSTLLNVIGGLDKADSGSISYDNLKMEKYNMKKMDLFRKNNVGYVFQNYLLIENKTVYDNLRIALEIIGIYDEVEKQKRIEYVLKSVGLFKYRKKLAGKLSGGEQQTTGRLFDDAYSMPNIVLLYSSFKQLRPLLISDIDAIKEKLYLFSTISSISFSLSGIVS